MSCKMPICTRPALKWDLCAAHLVLFCHLLDNRIDIPEFDRLGALPVEDMLREINRRFVPPGRRLP